MVSGFLPKETGGGGTVPLATAGCTHLQWDPVVPRQPWGMSIDSFPQMKPLQPCSARELRPLKNAQAGTTEARP